MVNLICISLLVLLAKVADGKILEAEDVLKDSTFSVLSVLEADAPTQEKAGGQPGQDDLHEDDHYTKLEQAVQSGGRNEKKLPQVAEVKEEKLPQVAEVKEEKLPQAIEVKEKEDVLKIIFNEVVSKVQSVVNNTVDNVVSTLDSTREVGDDKYNINLQVENDVFENGIDIQINITSTDIPPSTQIKNLPTNQRDVIKNIIKHQNYDEVFEQNENVKKLPRIIESINQIEDKPIDKVEDSAEQTSEESVVKVRDGHIQGSVRRTKQGTSYIKFAGVPYAEPPVGPRRFLPPVSRRPWKGTWKGEEGRKCVQASEVLVAGSEDCLYLNVWLPQTKQELLPVMVWIHGGFFLFGSGDDEYQSFDRLIDKDVIVVSMNYRLGALGFFCLGRYSSNDCNLGLRDQRLALDWIKQNIFYFGGDPHRITLFGQGSGAESVQAHVLSPTSRSLFSAAILQSGTVFSKLRFRDTTLDVLESSQRLAAHFNCSVDVNCLRGVPADRLMQRSVTPEGERSDPDPASSRGWFWLPVSDQSFALDPIFSKDPLESILSDDFHGVSVLTGVVEGEGSIYFNPIRDKLGQVEDLWDTLGSSYLLQTTSVRSGEMDKLVANTLTRFYVGNMNISSASPQDFTDMLSDAYFTVPVLMSAELHSRKTSSAYCYIIKEPIEGESGLRHGDDLVYLFANEYIFSEDQSKVAKSIVTRWTNFAKSGNPNLPVELDEERWDPLSQGSRSCFLFQASPKMEDDPYPERMLLWRRLVWDPVLSSVESKKKTTSPVMCPRYEISRILPVSPINIHQWFPYFHIR